MCKIGGNVGCQMSKTVYLLGASPDPRFPRVFCSLTPTRGSAPGPN